MSYLGGIHLKKFSYRCFLKFIFLYLFIGCTGSFAVASLVAQALGMQASVVAAHRFSISGTLALLLLGR